MLVSSYFMPPGPIIGMGLPLRSQEDGTFTGVSQATGPADRNDSTHSGQESKLPEKASCAAFARMNLTWDEVRVESRPVPGASAE